MFGKKLKVKEQATTNDSTSQKEVSQFNLDHIIPATERIKDSAKTHIQMAGNFAEGKIATHNTKIDYQERYDKWQSNLEHNENGNVITHTTEKDIDMDHIVSAAELIRNPTANAHLTEEERIAFANSDQNLNALNAEKQERELRKKDAEARVEYEKLDNN